MYCTDTNVEVLFKFLLELFETDKIIYNTGGQKNDMLCDVCFLTNFGSLIPNLIFIFLG